MVQDDEFVKYLSPEKEADLWGISVTTAGHALYLPGAPYPKPRHPSSHTFSLNRGRVLNEYQIVYIARGSGRFESSSIKSVKISEGTAFLLFPGEWHRYYPDPATGWKEFWIGFRGREADNILQGSFFRKEAPVLEVGVSYSIISMFLECFSYLRNETPGFRYAVGGLVLHLLGLIFMKERSRDIPTGVSEELIARAKSLMISSPRHGMRPEDVARELGIGYSRFRKSFRQATGVPPAQYMLQALIAKAKELLAGDLPISEIAYTLGFENPAQFSALFHKKEGLAPISFRKSTFR